MIANDSVFGRTAHQVKCIQAVPLLFSLVQKHTKKKIVCYTSTHIAVMCITMV